MLQYGEEVMIVIAAFLRPCQGGARLASGSVSSLLSPVSWVFWILDLMPWVDKISSLNVNAYLVGL